MPRRKRNGNKPASRKGQKPTEKENTSGHSTESEDDDDDDDDGSSTLVISSQGTEKIQHPVAKRAEEKKEEKPGDKKEEKPGIIQSDDDDPEDKGKPVLKVVEPKKKQRRNSSPDIERDDVREPEIAQNDPKLEAKEKEERRQARAAQLRRSASTEAFYLPDTGGTTSTTGSGNSKKSENLSSSANSSSSSSSSGSSSSSSSEDPDSGDEIVVREHSDDEEPSEREKRLNDIAAMGDERKILLRRVMVEHYADYKRNGVYGDEEPEEDSADEDNEEEDDDSEGSGDEIPDKVVDLLKKGAEKKHKGLDDDDDDGLLDEGDENEDEEDEDEEEDPSLVPGSYGRKKSMFSKIVNLKNATLATGALTDVLNLTTFGNMGMNMKLLFTDNAQEKKGLAEKYKTAKDVNNYVSIGSNTISGTMNFINMLDKSNAMIKTNNARKSDQLGFGAGTHAFGLLANASKILSSVVGLAGDPTNNKSDKGVQSFFNVMGSVFGTAASGMTLAGSLNDKHTRGKIMEAIDDLKVSGTNDSSGDYEYSYREHVKEQKKFKKIAPQVYKNAKASYRGFKARKYTLQDAKEFQEIKKNQMTKGITGTVTNGLATAATLFSLIPGMDKVTGTVGALTGPLAYLANTTAKWVGVASDVRTGGKIEKKKAEVVGRYLTRKRARIVEQARNAFSRRNDTADLSDNLTDDEKDRITLGRLTGPEDVVPSPVDEKKKQAAFPKLNIKRAKSILQADERTRKKIFEALHLSENATIDELCSALEGD